MKESLTGWIARWLEEDVGWGDVTSEAVIPATHRSQAVIFTKEEGICAGIAVAQEVFAHVDERMNVVAHVQEGEEIVPRQPLLTVQGRTRSILLAERLALNLLQRLSGIATVTQQYVQAVQPYAVRITDTRKTTPGLRQLEKQAVRAGGGHPHRFGLSDAVLIKDNHIRAAGDVVTAIRRAQAFVSHMTKIEVEIEHFEQLDAVCAHALDIVDVIMLDNMSPPQVTEAIQRLRVAGSRCTIEVSGGIRLEHVSQYASTGCDIISIGALTHGVASLDLSLELEEGTGEV